jgi:hypothetical protein
MQVKVTLDLSYPYIVYTSEIESKTNDKPYKGI